MQPRLRHKWALGALCLNLAGAAPLLSARPDSTRALPTVVQADSTADTASRHDSLKAIAAANRVLAPQNLSPHALDSLRRQLDSLRQHDSLRNALRRVAIARLRGTRAGTPVRLKSDTLFLLYSGIGAFSPVERAEAIHRRLTTLLQEPLFLADSLGVSEIDAGSELEYLGRPLLTITDQDADWAGVGRQALAWQWRTRVQAALQQARRGTELWHALGRAAGAGLTGLALVLLEFLLFRYLSRLKTNLARRSFRPLKFQRVTVFSDTQFRDTTLIGLRIAGWIAHLLLAYAAMLVSFAFFPWTRDFAAQVLRWTFDPFRRVLWGFFAYLPSLLNILVIFVIAHFIMRALRKLSREIGNGNIRIPGFYEDWAHPTLNIFRFIVYALVLVAVFPYLPGSHSPVFKGVSVFLGVLFSLGSSSAFSNIVAGLVITYMRSFRQGDRIRVGDISGDVIEKTLLVTRLRTAVHNEIVTVPNSLLLSGNTYNYSAAADSADRLMLHTAVTIGYNVPWRQVHALLLDAVKATEGLLLFPDPFVLQRALDDFYVRYEVNAATDSAREMINTYSRLHQNIQDAFQRAGVEICSPHFRAMRDGNTPAIPPPPPENPAAG